MDYSIITHSHTQSVRHLNVRTEALNVCIRPPDPQVERRRAGESFGSALQAPFVIGDGDMASEMTCDA